jgi:hypothetical protein
VASGDTLFRSLNDGDGWEPAGRFAGESIDVVRVSPQRAGLVAVATTLPNNAGSRVHLSPDCGETWPAGGVTLGFRVQDQGRIQRGPCKCCC